MDQITFVPGTRRQKPTVERDRMENENLEVQYWLKKKIQRRSLLVCGQRSPLWSFCKFSQWNCGQMEKDKENRIAFPHRVQNGSR